MPPQRKKQLEQFSVSNLSELFSRKLRHAANRPTIYAYTPHEKQLEFHTAKEKGRLYLGGNRGGKTVGGVVEDIWWLLGEHPYMETPRPPVRGRIVAVDLIQGVQKIIIPEITKWLPPSKLINGSWEESYDKRLRTLTLENGSFVELMSYDQDLDKFAGTSRHFVHYDEEPPKSIFTECKARLVDVAGSWWMTMTPIDGMASFVFDDIYIPGQVPGSGIRVIQVAMTDNPYLSEVEIEEFLSGLSEVERKARGRGEFVEIGGAAFKDFRTDIHVVTTDMLKFDVPPYEWDWYVSMDDGFNNPTSWLYHAVTPTGTVLTWDELYSSEVTIPEWAQRVHQRNSEHGRAPGVYVGDPAIKQRSGQNGFSKQATYATNGIPIVLGDNDQRSGVDKMNNYLRAPKWFITTACPNLIRQLQRVRWETWATVKSREQNNPKETLHKKDDHATDAARYFYSMLPDVRVDEKKKPSKAEAMRVIQETLSPVAGVNPYMSIDMALARSRSAIPEQDSEWTIVDEHMGGIY